MPNIAEFPSHTQSVERAVKLVTEASTIVYSFDNRHKTILTKILSRKLRPNVASKCSYTNNMTLIFKFQKLTDVHFL